MKDPLQTEQTPYEVLGIPSGTTSAEVDRAFMEALRRRVPPNIAKSARDALLDESRRAWTDARLYDDSALAQVSPSPVENPDVLGRGHRLATATQWERQLKARFPDPHLVHCLAVLWYWWAHFEQERFSALVDAAVESGGLPHGDLSRRKLLQTLRKREGVACEPSRSHQCNNADCPWREDCFSPAPPLKELWERAIAYWVALACTDEFWSGSLGLTPEAAQHVRDRVIDSLRTTLLNLVTRYESALDHKSLALERVKGLGPRRVEALHRIGLHTLRDVARAGVSRVAAADGFSRKMATRLVEQARAFLGDIASLPNQYVHLDVALTTELEAATLAGKTVSTRHGKVACGRLMLTHMGVLERVRRQVDEQLQRQPKSKRLRRLRDALSPYSAILTLVNQGRAEAALEVLDGLPREERKKSEAKAVRTRVLRKLARDQLELDHTAQALDLWEEALACAGRGPLAEETREEVANYCHSKAASMPSSRRDDAIRILERALKLTDDDKCRSTLAAYLTERGIAHFLEGQKELEQMPEEIRGLCDRARAATERGDFDTAVELLRKANSIARTLQNTSPADRSKAKAKCEKGLHDLSRAARLGNPRAKEQREAGRNVLNAMSDDWRVHLRKSLAAALAARGINKANQALERLSRAADAHNKQVEALLFAIQRGALGGRVGLYGMQTCAMCSNLATHTWQPPDGPSVPLCTRHVGELQRLLEPPKPPASDIRLLQEAEADLAEALELDPENEHIRKNHDDAAEVLEKLGHPVRRRRRRKTAKRSRATTAPRGSRREPAASPSSLGNEIADGIGKVAAYLWWWPLFAFVGGAVPLGLVGLCVIGIFGLILGLAKWSRKR